MPGQTGQGTTVVFTTNGAVGCVRSVSLPEFSMEVIDASCLADTAFMKKIAGDLVDAGEVQITAVFEENDDWYLPDGVSDTITITLPDGGVFSASGYITSNTLPSAEINTLLEQSITFTPDGITGPTFVPGTP